MAWARLDDRANGHPKLLALSDAAHRLWSNGLIYCQQELTDGFVPVQKITTWGVKGNVKKAAEELCSRLVLSQKPDGGQYDALWHAVAGGFKVHDYLDWNDSKETILKKREGGKTRQANYRQRHASGPQAAVGNGVSDALPNALAVLGNASQAPLPLIGVTRHITHNARGTYQLGTSSQYHGSTIHAPEQELTRDYSADTAGAPLSPVEKSKPRNWTVYLAICHRVIEDYPDERGSWGEELKARMLNQGIDANDRGPKGDKDKLFVRVLAATIEQRKFRKGDGGVIAWRYRRMQRESDKRRRAG